MCGTIFSDLPSNKRPGYRELGEASMLLAFLECHSLKVEYCRKVLRIEEPVKLIPLLNAVGALSGFKVVAKEDTFHLVGYQASCDVYPESHDQKTAKVS